MSWWNITLQPHQTGTSTDFVLYNVQFQQFAHSFPELKFLYQPEACKNNKIHHPNHSCRKTIWQALNRHWPLIMDPNISDLNTSMQLHRTWFPTQTTTKVPVRSPGHIVGPLYISPKSMDPKILNPPNPYQWNYIKRGSKTLSVKHSCSNPRHVIWKATKSTNIH